MSVSVFDILEALCLKPVSGADLDKTVTTWGIVRSVGETDAQLRSRIKYMLKHQPGPNNQTLKLFVLLEKLGLTTCSETLDTFLPIGYPRR
jgi:hypothetical protein